MNPNEVPTYTPPDVVHGPTLGRDLPDGCERLFVSFRPDKSDRWSPDPVGPEQADLLYWWRPRPFQVGDRVHVQFTGTVKHVDARGCYVEADGNGRATGWFPSAALTPDDLVSRARRHAGTHPESRDLIEELLAAAPSSAAPDHESSTGNGEGEALADVDQVHTQAGECSGSPADPLRERIARAAAGGYMRVPIVALDGMYLGPPWLDVADAVLAVLPAPPIDEGAGPSGPPWYLAQDVWMALGGDSNAFSAWAHCEDDRRTWGDAWAQIIAAVGGSRMEGDTNPPPGTILDLPSYQWVRESPAPSPVPPWPGAVLSGLTDEDGVPTWLAQAGQVRGEQVRRRSDFMWVNNDQMVAHLDTVWVEVRAPRAVPEPETERVPWWEARDRLGLAGDPFVEVGSDDEGPWVRVVEGGTKLHSPVDPDGTVEVLKDGES